MITRGLLVLALVAGASCHLLLPVGGGADSRALDLPLEGPRLDGRPLEGPRLDGRPRDGRAADRGTDQTIPIGVKASKCETYASTSKPTSNVTASSGNSLVILLGWNGKAPLSVSSSAPTSPSLVRPGLEGLGVEVWLQQPPLPSSVDIVVSLPAPAPLALCVLEVHGASKVLDHRAIVDAAGTSTPTISFPLAAPCPLAIDGVAVDKLTSLTPNHTIASQVQAGSFTMAAGHRADLAKWASLYWTYPAPLVAWAGSAACFDRGP